MARIDEFLARLDHVRLTPNGWQARCPAHEDRSPSLSIAYTDEKILITCFAGCSYRAIAAALDWPLTDLFPAKVGRLHRRASPGQIWRKPNYRDLAGHFEAMALLCHLHSEEIRQAATGVSITDWSDVDLDLALAAVAVAYEDEAQAERFQQVACEFRAAAIK